MNNLVTIASISIRQDAEGRYCLNDLHRAAGGAAKDQPSRFLIRAEADDLRFALKEAALERGLPEFGYAPSVVINNDGINNGTYVVKELVYAYAMWVSAKFHLHVIRAYDQMVTASQPTPRDNLQTLTPDVPSILDGW